MEAQHVLIDTAAVKSKADKKKSKRRSAQRKIDVVASSSDDFDNDYFDYYESGESGEFEAPH